VESEVEGQAVKRIPIQAARDIAERYGYDQIVIYARKVGADPELHGEHMTTYGVNKEHCKIAGDLGTKLQLMMGWNVRR
jgi:hypothetical protein